MIKRRARLYQTPESELHPAGYLPRGTDWNFGRGELRTMPEHDQQRRHGGKVPGRCNRARKIVKAWAAHGEELTTMRRRQSGTGLVLSAVRNQFPLPWAAL
jgi:hypothetical protein